MTPNDTVDAIFTAAARALHPTDGPLYVLESRVAELERQVAHLTQYTAALVRVIDLLAEQDGA